MSLARFQTPLCFFSCLQDKIQRSRCHRRLIHPGLSSLSASNAAAPSLPCHLGHQQKGATYCLFPGRVLPQGPAFLPPPPPGRLSPSSPEPIISSETCPDHLPGTQLPILPLCCPGNRSQCTELHPPEQSFWFTMGGGGVLHKGLKNNPIP